MTENATLPSANPISDRIKFRATFREEGSCMDILSLEMGVSKMHCFAICCALVHLPFFLWNMRNEVTFRYFTQHCFTIEYNFLNSLNQILFKRYKRFYKYFIID